MEVQRMSLGDDNYGGPMTVERFQEAYRDASDKDRWELQEGVPKMQASPSKLHDSIVGEFFYQVKRHLRRTKCYPGLQRDIVLTKSSLFIPDMFILCDPSKDDGKTIHGAPNLVLEVWSPSNGPRERKLKIKVYKEVLTPVIIEVYPDSQTIIVHHLEGDRYEVDTMVGQFEIEVPKFSGMLIDLTECFVTE